VFVSLADTTDDDSKSDKKGIKKSDSPISNDEAKKQMDIWNTGPVAKAILPRSLTSSSGLIHSALT
jgi:hypothetical protein